MACPAPDPGAGAHVRDRGGTLRRLLKLLVAEPAKLATILAATVASVVLHVIGPWRLGRATDLVDGGVTNHAAIDFAQLARLPPAWFDLQLRGEVLSLAGVLSTMLILSPRLTLIAIVCPTGAGRTTLMNLLLRFDENGDGLGAGQQQRLTLARAFVAQPAVPMAAKGR